MLIKRGAGRLAGRDLTETERTKPHLLVVPTVRSEAGPGREVLLDTAVHPGREVELHVESLLGVSLLGWVLVEHDDDLSHVVELADHTDVLHGSAPLLVLALEAELSTRGPRFRCCG